MENKTLSLQQRLKHIVEESYQILCQQICCGKFTVYNEASLQLQFSVILKSIGQLYEFSRDDHFDIELEENIKLKENTSKSQKGKARCDICIMIYKGMRRPTYQDESLNTNIEYAKCDIELKCFKAKEGETITDNRFAILEDMENLEHYKQQDTNIIGYEIVYTDNKTYPSPNSRSKIKIGEGHRCQGTITYNSHTVNIQQEYTFHWDKYSGIDVGNSNEKDHYFLKVQI